MKLINIKKILIKLKYNTGFTVVELLAGIFIISLISGIFLANYRVADNQAKLINAAQKLASDIKLAQSYTLGLREFEGSFPDGGWGVRLTQGLSSYIIFADTSEGYDYTAGEEYITIDLPDNITIDSITDPVGGGPLSPLDIVFTPPDPITYINTVSNVSVDIVLKDSQTELTKTITVNFLGLVDVVN